MSDAAALLRRFDEGALLRPDPALPNLVDLSLALAASAGVDRLALTANGQLIAAEIGEAYHVVLVLVDGLGMHLVERHPEAGVFREHLRMELRTVFPSSTAPALTSLATGLWPAQHAVPGWWTYLPDPGLVGTILPFTERFSEKPLSQLGVEPRTAFPAQPLAARFTSAHFRVMPKPIHDSVYSRYSSGNAPGIGYTSMQFAVEATEAHIRRAAGPTQTFFYIPFVDTAQHERGPASKDVSAQLRRVAVRVRLLIERLHGVARVVITADHGQIEVPRENMHVIRKTDSLAVHLRESISCEPRVAAIHLRDGAGLAFESQFRARFGDQFALLTIAEADELRLFGPDPLAPETRRRLGDYVAIALADDVLLYEPDAKLMKLIGFHGGLLPDEVRIPLIIV